MKKFKVSVTQLVEVELDETKFDDRFMREFRERMYPLHSLGDHAEHIAQLEARGLFDGHFIEGYGHAADMGIKARIIDQYQDIES